MGVELFFLQAAVLALWLLFLSGDKTGGRIRGECTQSSGCVVLLEGEGGMGMGLVLGRGEEIKRGEERGRTSQRCQSEPLVVMCLCVVAEDGDSVMTRGRGFDE